MNKIVGAVTAWVILTAILSWVFGYIRDAIIKYVDDNYDDIDWDQ
jgi:hypothetical protein